MAKTDFLDFAQQMQCEELHMFADHKLNMKAIIAIHNTNRGPSLGGCRFLSYENDVDAVIDAIKLAQGMSYKSAISDLPLGGGKAVVMNPGNCDRKAIFNKLGEFLNKLQGRYITAVDVGVSVADMDLIAETSQYVVSTSKGTFTYSDPSLMTARGVKQGILSSVKHKLGADTVNGLTVAIQGLGHVGFNLAKMLVEDGATVVAYDVNEKNLQQANQELGVKPVSSFAELIAYSADVFAPCALGGILSPENIKKLKAPIVAGGANNQLSTPDSRQLILDRKILYAPDFVINAGGIIYVAGQYVHNSEENTIAHVDKIYNTLQNVFARADNEGCSTEEVAMQIAMEKIYGK